MCGTAEESCSQQLSFQPSVSAFGLFYMHHEDSEDSTADKSTPETVDPSPHVPVTPVLGKGARWIEVAGWPASLAKRGSFTFNERPCFKTQGEGWRDGSNIKSLYYSYRRLELPALMLGNSQLPGTPAPEQPASWPQWASAHLIT